MDQISKLPPEVKQLDSAADEEVFRKNIKDHRDREAAKAKQIQAEEAAKKAAAEAAVAAQKVKFFTSIFEEDKAKMAFSKSSANLKIQLPAEKEEGAAAGGPGDHGSLSGHSDSHIVSVGTPVSTSVHTSDMLQAAAAAGGSTTSLGGRRGGVSEEAGSKMEQVRSCGYCCVSCSHLSLVFQLD